MVGSVTVARLTRFAANCICPVVGAGVITATVPPVRHAVHHLTAPHEYALPKTRVRPVAVAPCAPAALPALAALAPAAPAAPFADGPLGGAAPAEDIAALTPTSFPVVPSVPGGPTEIGFPTGGVPIGPGTPGGPTALPDGRTWMQLIVGFGLVGGTARFAQARARSEA